MSLTIGSAPFGNNPGVFNFERRGPKHVLYWEDSPRRVRVELGGETVAASSRMKLLHETGLLPVYYFPEADVRADLLVASEHTSHCPFKGDARYFSVKVGERTAENAVWSYPEPLEGSPPLAGYLAFYWKKMDAWFEESEQVFVHPRDPYHRTDVLQSSRRVKASLEGVVLAESERPLILFETGLPPRYYLPLEDVATNLLEPSTTRTECPYKGSASYFSFRIAGERHDYLAWTYPDPRPAVASIAGRICFHDERVGVEIDGELQERPKTRWSR